VILILEGVPRGSSCAHSTRCFYFSKAVLDSVVVGGITSATNYDGRGGDVVCCW
jgi:hypothetical protein